MICTLLLLSPHSQQFCLYVSLSSNIWALRVVWPFLTAPSASVYSLLETVLYCLAESHSLRSWTGDNLYRLPSIQVLLSQMIPDDFFAHNIGDANNLVRRDSISAVPGQFISFFISHCSMCPSIHTKVTTLLDPLSSSSAHILSHTTDLPY